MGAQDLPGPSAVVTRGTAGDRLDQEIYAAARNPRGRAQRRQEEIAAGFPPRARLTGNEVRPGRGANEPVSPGE